jgi:hypothetical protein
MTPEPDDPEAALREFCARVLGYERKQAIEHALRSIRLSVTHAAALMLLGDIDADLVSVARALHRHTVGADRPFILCDRRLRRESSAAVAAAQAARGGSLCLRRRRVPDDYSSAVALVRDPTAAVQLIICADTRFDVHPFATLPVPLVVPTLQERAGEVPRIVDGYAADAVASLEAYDECFTPEDRARVIENAKSLTQIETATLRLVACRFTGSIEEAARRLRMPNASLRQWRWRHRVAQASANRRPEPTEGA